MVAVECEFCATETGRYAWDRVCCRARFISGLPMIALRRGWMALWKQRESAAFYADIEREVGALWKIKKGGSVAAGTDKTG